MISGEHYTTLKGGRYGIGFDITIDMEWRNEPGGDCEVTWWEKWYTSDHFNGVGFEEIGIYKEQMGDEKMKDRDPVKAWNGRKKSGKESVVLRDRPNIKQNTTLVTEGISRRRRIDIIIHVRSGCSNCRSADIFIVVNIAMEKNVGDDSKTSVHLAEDSEFVRMLEQKRKDTCPPEKVRPGGGGRTLQG